MPVRTLKAISIALLKARIRDIWSVGVMEYELARHFLLHSAMTAPQLLALEEASPHLYPATEEVWKDLSVRAFVNVRIQVEDGMLTETPAGGWRALYEAEDVKHAAKLHDAELRLREKRKEYVEGRATSKPVDGVRLAKRSKVSNGGWSTSRPKTLLERARDSGRRITSMHAPTKRRPPAPVTQTPSLLTNKGKEVTRVVPPPNIVQTVKMVNTPRTGGFSKEASNRPIVKLPTRAPTLFHSPRPPPPPSPGGSKRPSIFLPKRP
ncbi:hypothetical protein P7C70_g4224, partial [Phenoliferia sp. Uapishka_3]